MNSAPFTSPFTDRSTAAEVLDGVNVSGLRVVITGGATGIGAAVASALAGAGAEVTIAIRAADTDAGVALAAQVMLSNPAGSIAVRALDLVELGSVSQFADRWDGPLDVLINNAGVMNAPETRTAYGWELQFATNYLGHAALARGLQPALTQSGAGRIVAVSSSAHRRSPVVFDDPFYRIRAYDPDEAYAQSKSAINLFVVEADRLWAPDKIRVNAVMPGGIWTDIQRHLDPTFVEARKAASRAAGSFVKNVDQGAAPILLMATSPTAHTIGGRYIDEDCQEAGVVSEQVGRRGVLDYSMDSNTARQLWTATTHWLTTASAVTGR